jgi:hypothetical protein
MNGILFDVPKSLNRQAANAAKGARRRMICSGGL